MANRFTSRQEAAIGKIGEKFDLGGSLTNVEKVLGEFAKDFVREAGNNLQRTKSVSSGELLKSLRFELHPRGGGYALTIYAADYYDFVNQCVKGVKSSDKAPNSPYSFRKLTVGYEMATSIRKWMIRHNVKSFRQNKDFKHAQVKTFQETSQSMSFRIAAGIKRNGLRATYFWDNAYDKYFPGLAPKLAQALETDVSIVLRNMVVKRGEIT